MDAWNDTPARQAIEDFVAWAAENVPPEDRVAVFDNDGTLWCEKPMPIQLAFTLQRLAAMVEADPSLGDEQPWKAAAEGDGAWFGSVMERHYAGDDALVKVLMRGILEAFAGITVDDYAKRAAAFVLGSRHPTLERTYGHCAYAPMIELLRHLEANGFATFIASGGDRDFMRPITPDYYGIPPERVVGSAVGLEYDAAANAVRYGAAFQFLDDGPEKPVRIWSRIGRRPILACGNSNGDMEMLRFVQGQPRSLSLLVHHDDDTGRGDPPYDSGAEQILDAATAEAFTIVSVKDDWTTVFRSPAQ